ncbi:hypothetical protein CHELA20_50361 [Hyphomicrobiales bacterium]|nr:hypothetical protein CHELA41_20013 [Hyphomicrobiales bacterium]CAH1668505.1 hypothetical protein CHELA20_50361 [Hyphomicrobiales bacterium]
MAFSRTNGLLYDRLPGCFHGSDEETNGDVSLIRLCQNFDMPVTQATRVPVAIVSLTITVIHA